jgi:hypothetical protein
MKTKEEGRRARRYRYCEPHNRCTYLKFRRSEALDWEYFLLPTGGWTGVCKTQRYVTAP